MAAPRKNEIYDAVIRRMVTEALERQEAGFAREHETDSDDALLEYLCRRAGELGHSPRYKEVVGWKLIGQRFGSWNEALRAAGLTTPAACPVTKLPRIIQETENQKTLYRQKKQEKRQRNLKRMGRSEEKRKAEACVPPPDTDL